MIKKMTNYKKTNNNFKKKAKNKTKINKKTKTKSNKTTITILTKKIKTVKVWATSWLEKIKNLELQLHLHGLLQISNNSKEGLNLIHSNKQLSLRCISYKFRTKSMT